MMTLSRACIPDSKAGHKMPLKQKLIDDNDNEADLSDKGISGLEEIPNISESYIYLFNFKMNINHNNRCD